MIDHITPHVFYSKVMITPEGGIAYLLENRTGANSIKGTVVTASSSFDNAVDINPADSPKAIGVIYENNIPNGSMVWVVCEGFADVLLQDGTSSTSGNWVKVSDTVAGRADASNAMPPGGTIPYLEDHLSEIGHCFESKSSGTNVLARIKLHYN